MRPMHALRLLALLALVQGAIAQPAPQPAEFITGDVVTADGKPAAGATVAVLGYRKDGDAEIQERVQADDNGKFTIGLHPDARELFACIPGAAISAPGRTDATTVHLKLQPAVDVALTWIAPDGAPAAGLDVRPRLILFRRDADPFPLSLSLAKDIAADFSGKTDDAGKCTIHGLPRDAEVLFDIDDPRYAHLDFSASVMMETDGNIVHAHPIKLLNAATISGQLLNPETHEPVAGIELNAQSYGSTRQGWGTAKTDAQGNFTIGQLVPSMYAVSLDVPRDNSSPWVAAAADVKLAEGQQARADLKLERGGTLKGAVRDAATGKGLPGMQVGLYGPSRPQHAASIESRTTDADGRFAFHVPAGEQHPYLAMTAPDGYLQPAQQGMQSVTVAAGQTIEVNFDLQPDPTPLIEGRVIDPDGKPAPNALIQIPSDRNMMFGRTVTADADGKFHLHAKPGTKLTARLGDLSTAFPVTAIADAPMEIQLEKEARFTLIVHITDAAGNAVPGSSAELTTMTGQFGSSGTPHRADAKGVARFESLPMDGKYDVSAQADGYGDSQTKVGPPPFDEPRELELPIVIHKATEEISGRVLDKDNKPVPNITVELNGISTVDTTTDADGKFIFHVVKHASEALYIRLENGDMLTAVTARAGEKDIVLHNFKEPPHPAPDALP